jgi:Uncharacterized protein conserved in bacteria (DUF2219)
MLKIAKLALIAIGVMAASSGLAVAEERVTLGWGRLFTNDALGDGKDRWQTGSYQVSRIRGFSWGGALPSQPGDIWEFRATSQIAAPADLVSPEVDDRRYAALLAFGLHTQWGWQGNELGLGAGVSLAGPQNGISNFQEWIHRMLGLPQPLVVEQQIGNSIFPVLEAEVGRRIAVTEAISLRPFAQAEIGPENLLRLGGDLAIGAFGRDDLMVRDGVTGQRYRAVEGTRDQGLSLVLGGDYARVFDSRLLPSDVAATATDYRSRLRAGVQWQGEKASGFYGLTYLGKEFAQQSEGQLLGSLSINLKF